MGARGLDRRPAGGRLARALLPVPHRARRSPRPPAPHRAPGVLGPEGRVPRRRGLPRHAPRHRRAGAAAARSPGRIEGGRRGAVVHRLADGRQLRDPRRRALHLRARRPAARRFHHRARRVQGSDAAARRLPRPDGGAAHPSASGRDRRARHRRRLLPQRPGHPPSRADRRRRDPRVGPRRQPRGVDAAARPPGQGRPHRQAAGCPVDAGEAGLAARALRRLEELARLPRDARAVQPHAAARAALHRRHLAQDARRPHGLHVERHRDRGDDADRTGLRDGVGGVLGPALLAPRRGGPEAGAGRGLRPDLVQHLGRHGRDRPARLLLRPERARAPDRRRRRCTPSSSA